MVEQVDTRDLKSLGFGCAGSSPAPGTRKAISKVRECAQVIDEPCFFYF